MDFKQKVQMRKNAYTGELTVQQLRNAYQQGIEDLAEELKKRFEEESGLNSRDTTQAGLFRAIGILSEYGN
jgi:hypothetical protein